MTENETKQAKNRAVLVGLNAHCLSAEENADDTSMEELADLLETAGGVCVGTVFQNKDAPDPRTFIGEGKAAEVKELVGAMGADMVVVDNPLSPSQQRVLSEELGVQVLDRAALILDIFAQRARTREGRLQVELAQYQYLLPRLTGMWTHLERQAGTSGKGPIGSKGPGETQLETDRRHIRRKIDKLREDLEAANAQLDVDLSPEEIRDYMNRYLPDAIAVREVKEAAPRFHARYKALGKTYRYVCFDGPVKPVFDRKYVTLLDFHPDLERMQQAAAYLQGEHDFASFCGNPRMKKSTVRLVDSITVVRQKDRIVFTFHGTGFLQNMVRILVGTLLEVGRGTRQPEDMPALLEARDRRLAGPTAPPEGLCLMKVDY